MLFCVSVDYFLCGVFVICLPPAIDFSTLVPKFFSSTGDISPVVVGIIWLELHGIVTPFLLFIFFLGFFFRMFEGYLNPFDLLYH